MLSLRWLTNRIHAVLSGRRSLLYTSVAGVTYEGRQRTIKKFVRRGSQVVLEPEPFNTHDKHAVAVYLKAPWRHIGYLPRDVNRDFSVEDVVSVKVHNIKGGERGLSYGVDLVIKLRRGFHERHAEVGGSLGR